MCKKTFFLLVSCLAITTMQAQEYKPSIHGTIRGKYERQFSSSDNHDEEAASTDAQRFEVRNARISVDGLLNERVSYKAEIDLCDEGAIKMLDAYGRVKLTPQLDVQIGQYRVPFTIDAHRSPHQQYFANRSFIAKQVGSIRDVGLSATYTNPRNEAGWGNIVQGGLFNGSGLTGQKDYWTSSINFSLKEQLLMPQGWLLEASMQKVSPDGVTIMMYDGALQWHNHNWICEAEYVYKNYAHDAFDGVNALDAFVCYDQWLKGCPAANNSSYKDANDKLLQKISYLARFDYMSDNSDGFHYLDGSKSTAPEATLRINDSARKRLTAGITLSFGQKAFTADLRLNYEKYFYDEGAKIKTSEHDKVVAELMVRF